LSVSTFRFHIIPYFPHYRQILHAIFTVARLLSPGPSLISVLTPLWTWNLVSDHGHFAFPFRLLLAYLETKREEDFFDTVLEKRHRDSFPNSQ
jgi:hypothetical protein